MARVIASALARSDGVEGGHNDRLPPQVLGSRSGQHDALVGLHGQLGQQLDSLPVVANRERLEAEHRLQLDQCSRRVCSRCPYSSQLSMPTLSWLATSLSNGGTVLISAKDDAGKAQVAELHREAQPIGHRAAAG